MKVTFGDLSHIPEHFYKKDKRLIYVKVSLKKFEKIPIKEVSWDKKNSNQIKNHDSLVFAENGQLEEWTEELNPTDISRFRLEILRIQEKKKIGFLERLL